ncbi:Spermidine/putrescine-binding protein [Rhizobiales bacterium GAS191]|jgi:spermidine/putrescine-binding protein|nr:Spermidine/putrescine-binding protein [Rhizobiales bacterium GAS113]SED72880.1 Spermidine/putrescine-binding protein [Rhizobiales bacterium GAS188]SEE80765.1 Spermidine/putrescine-binding protein [Rhizobiales bacterium GAS191]
MASEHRKLDRRHLLKGAALSFGAFSFRPRTAYAAGQTVTLADIGVGDPNGDWSGYAGATGNKVNVVSIGNGPSAVLNQLIAGGGRQSYDIINIVGGMQKPLVENKLILPIDVNRLKNWQNNEYLSTYFKPGSKGFDFIGYDGKIYGVPTVLQGDAFAYLPEKTGELNSYAALFDPKFRGYVAVEDNYTTIGQKAALYLKSAGLADIKDPADMSKDEIKKVVDFLIQKKKEGQFRVVWSSFEQAVNLLVNKEVYVMDCWEPMVFAAKAKGVNAVYAAPKEGYLLWAMAAYIVAGDRSPEKMEASYQLLDYMLSPEYGAMITNLRGYMTNPAAPDFASKSTKFDAATAKKIAAIDAGVKVKFQAGGSWQTRWPTNITSYEEEWQRFKAA